MLLEMPLGAECQKSLHVVQQSCGKRLRRKVSGDSCYLATQLVLKPCITDQRNDLRHRILGRTVTKTRIAIDNLHLSTAIVDKREATGACHLGGCHAEMFVDLGMQSESIDRQQSG